jgi:hypothetical protein
MSIEYVDYSDKSWAVFGNTKDYKDKLLQFGGKYQPGLTWDEKRTPGWVFAKSKHNENSIKNIVNQLNRTASETESPSKSISNNEDENEKQSSLPIKNSNADDNKIHEKSSQKPADKTSSDSESGNIKKSKPSARTSTSSDDKILSGSEDGNERKPKPSIEILSTSEDKIDKKSLKNSLNKTSTSNEDGNERKTSSSTRTTNNDETKSEKKNSHKLLNNASGSDDETERQLPLPISAVSRKPERKSPPRMPRESERQLARKLPIRTSDSGDSSPKRSPRKTSVASRESPASDPLRGSWAGPHRDLQGSPTVVDRQSPSRISRQTSTGREIEKISPRKLPIRTSTGRETEKTSPRKLPIRTSADREFEKISPRKLPVRTSTGRETEKTSPRKLPIRASISRETEKISPRKLPIRRSTSREPAKTSTRNLPIRSQTEKENNIEKNHERRKLPVRTSVERENTKSTYLTDNTDRELVDYTNLSWAIIGDTKIVKDQLLKLGGKYQSGLTIDDKRTPGWIFPKSKYNEQQMLNIIKKLDNEKIRSDIYDLRALENWTNFDFELYLGINGKFKNYEIGNTENNKLYALISLSNDGKTTEFLSDIFHSEEFKRAIYFNDSRLVKALVKLGAPFVPDRKRLYHEVIYAILSNNNNFDDDGELSKEIFDTIVKMESRFQ